MQGVAQLLTKEVEDYSIAQGYELMWLGVWEGRALCRMRGKKTDVGKQKITKAFGSMRSAGTQRSESMCLT